MMRIITLFFLFIVPGVAAAQKVPKIRIDPAQAYGGSASEYFESIEYIPLETTKESTFGEARNILITDSSIVVYDYDTRSTLFFTPDGKFIRKVKEKESSYSRIYFDQYNRQIVIITEDDFTGMQYASYYSKTGIAQSKAKIQTGGTTAVKSRTIPIGSGYFATGTSFLLWPDKDPVDSSFGLVKIYKSEKLYKSLLPYNQQKHLAASILVGSVEMDGFVVNGTFYIGTPLEHEIYKLTKDTAVKVCKLVFPSDYSFPKETIESGDRKMLEDINRTISNDMQKVLFINTILFHNKLLFFKVNTKAISFSSGSEAKSQRNFIYNTENGKLVSMERINPDSLTYFLPITGYNTSISGFMYSNGNFYTQIASLKMFAEMEKNKFRNPQYPPALQQYFNTQNRKSNPVIVRMKLRDY
ncbi:6-bladed beta-propeller [Niabella aquatica]